MPVGTVVWRLDEDTERELVADLVRVEPSMVVRGGRGGRGNASFANATNQEPLLAEGGEEGERARLLLELKLLADVGIIGHPNAGKSTLLSLCSAARPKVAEYPFTTIDPALGVAEAQGDSFVLMEVPGLIEGAHLGAGLGHQFLRHAERSRLVWHLVDGAAEDLMQGIESVNRELRLFSHGLASKQQILVINKIDIPEARARAEGMRAGLIQQGYRVHLVSAATGEGVPELLGETASILASLPKDIPLEVAPPAEKRATRESRPADSVTKEGRVAVVNSPRLERIAAVVNLRDRRVVDQLWNEMVKMGLDKLLEEKGVEPGDPVRIGRAELEWK